MRKNNDPRMPWNDQVHKDDPREPWNDPCHKEDPSAPWNDRGASYEELDQWKEDHGYNF